jgi:hypothetical protein
MAARHRRTHTTIALLVALVLVTALTAACSAQATGGALAASGSSGDGASASITPAASGSSAAAGKAGDDDWERIAKALAWMRADPPTKPVVVLLGGSAARESTISDASWRKQIVSNGGPEALAWNMGSHNRTMAQNLAIVKELPKDADVVVFVGVNLGSFTSPDKTATIKLPSPAPTAQPSLKQPHQYSTRTGILSTSKKKAMVQQWLGKRYPVYKANFSRNAALLEDLIQLCKTRGYKPVLFELPRDTQIIGSSLNAPTTKFRDKGVALARKYAADGCKWVSFVSSARLPNGDFYDIWHLVEPGRKIWQAKLSAKTTALLKQYGFNGGS